MVVMTQLAFLHQLAQQPSAGDTAESAGHDIAVAPALSAVDPRTAISAPLGPSEDEVHDSTALSLVALDARVQLGRREACLLVRATHPVHSNPHARFLGYRSVCVQQGWVTWLVPQLVFWVLRLVLAFFVVNRKLHLQWKKCD